MEINKIKQKADLDAEMEQVLKQHEAVVNGELSALISDAKARLGKYFSDNGFEVDNKKSPGIVATYKNATISFEPLKEDSSALRSFLMKYDDTEYLLRIYEHQEIKSKNEAPDIDELQRLRNSIDYFKAKIEREDKFVFHWFVTKKGKRGSKDSPRKEYETFEAFLNDEMK